MAARGDDNKHNEGKGFAGLSSLVSDVDATPPPSSKKKMANPAAAAADSVPPSPPPQPQPRRTHQRPTQPPSGSSGGKWMLGIAAVIGAFWLFSQSNQPTTTSSAPTYPAQNTAPSSRPAQPQAPSPPTESKPQVGQNLVLSREQIRYCLAEEIRMNGAKAAVNNYSDSDVDRFNTMVADYNSRCGSFRYRSGALESARRDIEPHRSELQAEGRIRFVRGSTSSVHPNSASVDLPQRALADPPAASRSAQVATVKAIQQKLNELGYNAGATDGLMGKRTRSAILAFQRDNDLVTDGNPTSGLLQILAVSRPTTRKKIEPTARANNGVPQNAHLNYLGNDWECNRGYFKYSSECHAVQIPKNGKLTYLGNDWECEKGYRKTDGKCISVYTQ